MYNIDRLLEAELSKLSGKKYSLFVSRGATALYLSYSAILKVCKENGGLSKNKIVLPSTMCHSPANVAVYANLEPVFCDISVTDYTLDPDALEQILRSDTNILAVVSVSIFGHSPDLVRIKNICSRYQVSLIDDAAQSIGGTLEDKALGAWGDIGIYSFGHSKIIDVGWGGALVTDDEKLYLECRRIYRELKGPSDNISKLRSIYSETYYSIERLVSKEFSLSPLFWQFPLIFKELYVYKEDSPKNKTKDILDALAGLANNLKVRRENWELYYKSLKGVDHVILPDIRPGSAPWRFTFRISRDKRTYIMDELRKRNIDVSAWYPSLDPRFEHQKQSGLTKCSVAAVLEKEFINLWIEPEKVNHQSIIDTSRLIKELILKSDNLVNI